jgi:hypothetical protein
VGLVTMGLRSAAPLAERWNGRRWTIQRTPNPGDAQLAGVSCATRTSCTAVGHSNTFGPAAPVALAERWNGKKWSIQPTPNAHTPSGSLLIAVSCPSPTACIAVGSGQRGALIEQWDATR